MKPVYALSVRQPWAWLIVHGYKDVENRKWWPPKALIGQRIYIHAGLKQDYAAYEGDPAGRNLGAFIRDRVSLDARREWHQEHLHLGCIIGETTLWAAAGQWKPSPWFEGPVGFLLQDPIRYKSPIPCKGRLGFFKPVLP